MPRPMFDPRRADRLASFFQSTCDIEETTQTRNADGEVQDAWAVATGLDDIACQVAPNGGVEVKLPDQTYVVSNYTILLRGAYSLTEKNRCVVSGPSAGTYDILLVQSGSQDEFTRLLVRKVT